MCVNHGHMLVQPDMSLRSRMGWKTHQQMNGSMGLRINIHKYCYALCPHFFISFSQIITQTISCANSNMAHIFKLHIYHCIENVELP